MRSVRGSMRVNGADIHYLKAGEGPPVLLIMGLAGNADWWGEEFLEILSRHFSLLAFDNRGAGRSSLPEGPYTIPLLAEDARAIMDALGWGKASVIGFSMGGMIAQELALTHPGLVDKLVLISTFCGGAEAIQPAPDIATILNSPKEGIPEEVIARGTAWLLFPGEYLKVHPEKIDEFVRLYVRAPISPRAYAKQVEAVACWGCYSRLPQIQSPTLVITGDQDVIIPPGNSHILAKRIPASTLQVIEGAGHGITLQCPEETARAIVGFLS
ncbi:MAG: alpha/beta fold hydrolase [Candidatus Geothermincolales bacterium]